MGCIDSVGWFESIGCVLCTFCADSPASAGKLGWLQSTGCAACAWLCPAGLARAKKSSSKGSDGGGALGFSSFCAGSAASAAAGNARKLNGSELTGVSAGFSDGFSAGRSDFGLSGVSGSGGSSDSGCLESAERSSELEKEAPWRTEAASRMQTSHCSSLIFSSSFTSTNVQI